MFKRKKLSVAIMTALAATSASQATAEIEEIVVTATKRAVPLQDAAVTIQAIGSRDLENQNIQEFADYVKYLPNVNSGGRGPGQNEIYIRGAAVDAINITVAESQGSAPNVALYLDEQPVTAGGRNLDVYISDMERIEVLPGPQGTLYGASSMAGTVRLITNKPVIDEFSASFNGSWSQTSGGEDSNSAELMLNFPVIEGKLAARIALYNDRQGGYIDNVEGTFQADNSINPTFPGDSKFYAEGTIFANGDVVGPGGVTVPVIKTVASNAALVEDDFNDATYAGVRLGAKYLINDNSKSSNQNDKDYKYLYNKYSSSNSTSDKDYINDSKNHQIDYDFNRNYKYLYNITDSKNHQSDIFYKKYCKYKMKYLNLKKIKYEFY